MPRSRGYYWIKVEKVTLGIPKEIDTSGRIVECDPTQEQFECWVAASGNGRQPHAR
jgi:hypothetical protein